MGIQRKAIIGKFVVAGALALSGVCAAKPALQISAVVHTHSGLANKSSKFMAHHYRHYKHHAHHKVRRLHAHIKIPAKQPAYLVLPSTASYDIAGGAVTGLKNAHSQFSLRCATRLTTPAAQAVVDNLFDYKLSGAGMMKGNDPFTITASHAGGSVRLHIAYQDKKNSIYNIFVGGDHGQDGHSHFSVDIQQQQPRPTGMFGGVIGALNNVKNSSARWALSGKIVRYTGLADQTFEDICIKGDRAKPQIPEVGAIAVRVQGQAGPLVRVYYDGPKPVL